MKEGKHKKVKFKVIEKYSVLLLIATLLMSIGYAEMSGITLSVAANVKATVQDGVFITEVTRTDYEGADITNSQINSYVETTMNSTVVLGSSSSSTITYNVWLYNNSDKDHVFIGITKDDELYKNTNITYSTDLVPYETIIKAGQNMDFNITFSYVGTDTSNTTLNSILNFRFMEVPKLEVSSTGDITGIYPGVTKEASIIVTNYDSSGINGVPFDYTLATTIYDENGAEVTAPITATIFNESGTAVTKAVSMPGGEGVTETTHTYTLKLAWDASNNSADYAGKTYTYKLKAAATPNATETDGKYDEYTLAKEAPAEEPLTKITTAPFYFVTDPTSVETTTVEMADNKAAINLTVSNNDGTNWNSFETKYTIALDNADFTLYVNGVEYANNVAENIQLGAGSLINSVEAIELKPKTTSTTLTSEEICNLTITTTSPYVKTETIKIIATDKTAPTAPEITGGSEAWATSKKISVSKEATDVGTGVKYYQYIVDSDGQEIATIATGNVGSTASETSYIFNTDYDGYYVYFRAVDGVGNVGEWSNSQMLYIDINPPTVSAKSTETETVEEEAGIGLSTYFEISENGKAPITSEVYTDISNNDEVVTNTSDLAVGIHEIKCTVDKENGLTASATKTIEVEESFKILAETTEFEDDLGNSYTVPGGFGVRTDLATTVDKGIVIEDSTGNQFVWVPIGTITKSDNTQVTIEFGRYSDFSINASPVQSAEDYSNLTTIDSFMGECIEEYSYSGGRFDGSSFSNETSVDLKAFINSSLELGGYYLARFEASFGGGATIESQNVGSGLEYTSKLNPYTIATFQENRKASLNYDGKGITDITDQVPAFRKSLVASADAEIVTVTSTVGMLWNNIYQVNAAFTCRNLYAGNEYNNENFVSCDLVNSYAWDTALMFIQKCSGQENYATTEYEWTINNTGDSTDVVCNIFDMGGNLSEWTTETNVYNEISGNFYWGYTDVIRRI